MSYQVRHKVVHATSWVIALCSLTAISIGQFVYAADDEIMEEVVVTGSYISRSREELSTPVDVFDRDEFEAQGSPSMVDIIQNMPAVSGTVNRSDQFANGGTITGYKYVNIRGLGLARTLVLMNGKRVIVGNNATNAGERASEIGTFPNIALERIELLKNGGSTTYGSDAISGVFNYITRGDFEGFELQASHSFIDETDGDSIIGAIFGVSGNNYNWVTSVEYEERTELANNDANLEVDITPEDGSWPYGKTGLGNPGAVLPYSPVNNGITQVAGGPAYATFGFAQDPTCGTRVGQSGSFEAGAGQCGYYFTDFSNVIDPQQRFKVYTQVRMDIDDSRELYGDALYSRMESKYYGSPSYPPTSELAAPYGAHPEAQYIHPENPGLIDFINSGSVPAYYAPLFANALSTTPYLDADGNDTGLVEGGAIFWGRTLGVQGPAQIMPRTHDNMRLTFGSRGALPVFEDIDYDVSVVYNSTNTNGRGIDDITDNVTASLAGFGGDDCSGLAADRGDNAAGCYWFNPFGSSITAAPGSELANSQEVRDFFVGDSASTWFSYQTVVDAVFTGELPFAEMPGGAIAWAAGGQYMFYSFDFDPTGDNNAASDASLATPFVFLGAQTSAVTEATTKSAFVEAQLPVMENLNIDVGFRFVDYELDDTVQPRVSARWDVLDQLSIRASYEEAFRRPILPTQKTVSLQQVGGSFVTVETPVPTSLDPEETESYSIGVIAYPLDGLSLTIDYWDITLKSSFAREDPTSAGAEWVYGADGVTLLKIIVEQFNAEDVEIAGWDFAADYTWDTSFASWQVGINGTYASKFDIYDALQGETYDAVGKYNDQGGAPFNVRSVPELKTNLIFSMIKDQHFARIFVHYIDSYDVVNTAKAAVIPEIDSMVTVDAHYTYSFNDDKTTLTLSGQNLADEEPPAAPHELGYDMYTHTPIGRVIKLSAKHVF